MAEEAVVAGWVRLYDEKLARENADIALPQPSLYPGRARMKSLTPVASTSYLTVHSFPVASTALKLPVSSLGTDTMAIFANPTVL